MFVPQTHMPGAEAEVDFGEFHIVLAGKMTKVYLFSLRLSYSGKAVHRVFATASQEAFSKATCTPSGCWAGSRGDTFATTT